MKKELLSDLVEHGREIEFKYNDRMFSITYGTTAEGKEVISFCEFYKETTEVETFDELLKVSRNGITVLQMWEESADENVWIY